MAPSGTDLLEPPELDDALPALGGQSDGDVDTALQVGAVAAGVPAPLASLITKDDAEKAVKRGIAAMVAMIVVPLIVMMLGVAVIVALIAALDPFGGGDDGGAGGWPAAVPKVYRPIYELASEKYGVNAYLIASIHKQETDFSRNPAARGGQNSSGAAGPMQFLRATWLSFNKAFRSVQDKRPKSYPLMRNDLHSCDSVPVVLGCVYDDFDAILGAAQKLHADGADMNLKSAGTHRAVCRYIGACSEVDHCTHTKNRYCDVLPRAIKWEVEGGAVEGDGKVATAVRWAVSHDGVVEHPAHSNCGEPITTWLRHMGMGCGKESSWCGVFVHEAYMHAGIKLPGWMTYVPTIQDHIRSGSGPFQPVPKSAMKVGDVVTFNWDGGLPDHVGMVEADYSGGPTVKTIEGNTSDGVHFRKRYLGQITAVGRLKAAK